MRRVESREWSGVNWSGLEWSGANSSRVEFVIGLFIYRISIFTKQEDILSEYFRYNDTEFTQYATVRDMLTHCLGVPTNQDGPNMYTERGDMVWRCLSK